MNRFTCNFSGDCEESKYGEHTTLEECLNNCHGVEFKDARYNIYQFAPGEARYLAPSDQAEVVYRLTRIRVSYQEAENILSLIDVADWNGLIDDDRFLPFIRSVYQGPLTLRFIIEGQLADDVRDRLLELEDELNTYDIDEDDDDNIADAAAEASLSKYITNYHNFIIDLLARFEFPVSNLQDGDRLNFDLISESRAAERVTVNWENDQAVDSDLRDQLIVPGSAEYRSLPADLQIIVKRNAM